MLLERTDSMVELDQFKYTLSTYETPLKEVRDSLNLEAKIRRIDELDKTMERRSGGAELLGGCGEIHETREGSEKPERYGRRVQQASESV